MSEGKRFMYIIGGTTVAAILVIAGGIKVSKELAIVDHFFDFHVDEKAVHEEIERMNKEKKDRDKRIKEWVDDIHWNDTSGTSESNDRGTFGPPDRDN